MLILDKLEQSINALSLSYSETEAMLNTNITEVLKNTLRSGIIQNFEVAYELSFKFMKRWLTIYEDRDTINSLVRKDLFRYASSKNMIDDVTSWFEFHRLRNESAHTYNVNVADDIYNIVAKFLIEAKFLYNFLNTHNVE